MGTDGIIQSHPSGAQPINITVTRAIFDYQRITAAFQRGFHHVMSQRFPFDIVVVDYNPYVFGSGGNRHDPSPSADESPARATSFDDIAQTRTIRTRFVNCWFSNNQYTYASDNYLISENATIIAEAVYDTNIADDVELAQDGHDAVEAAHDRTWLGSVMTESYVGIGATNGDPSNAP